MAIFYNQATLIHNGQITNSNTTSAEISSSQALTKTAIINEYSENGSIAYLVTIENNRQTPITDATLSDNLGAYAYGTGALYPLEFNDGSLLYFVNGTLTDGAVATVNDGALQISGINLPAYSTAQLIYTVTANGFAPLEAGSQITNTVSLGELTASESISVKEESELSITKFVCTDNVSASGEIVYTFIIQNTGNTAAVATDDVIVVDTFDPVLNIDEVTLNGEALSENLGYTYNAQTGEFATLNGQITVAAATFTRAPDTGAVITTPGVSVITVRGTV